MDAGTLWNDFVSVLFYSGLGVFIFAIAFFLMVKISPFSVVKEIEEDQNTALGILFGSVFIGLAIVIAELLSNLVYAAHNIRRPSC